MNPYEADRYYPLDPHKDKYFPIDKNFTNFNNVQYQGDRLGKYDVRVTNLSNEDIFVNLNLYNQINNVDAIDMTYNESRQTSILPYKPDAYKMCVISTYIPETSIFLFEWSDSVTPITGTPYDKYTVSVEYNNNGVINSNVTPIALEFTPYIVSDGTNGTIRRVFEINQCLASLNKAFDDAWQDLALSDPNILTIKPPLFYLNKNNSIITLVADQQMNPIAGANAYIANPNDWGTGVGNSWVKLSYNYWVAQWFESTFPSIITSSVVSEQPVVTLAIFRTGDPNQLVTYANSGDATVYYEMNQGNSSTDLFSTVEKVLVVSSIQARPQYTSVTALGSISNISGNTMQSLNILADFPLTLSSFNNSEISAPLVFSPLHHAWTDIITQDAMNLLNYRIFVQRTNGVITPLSLLVGQCATIKILFRLK